MRHLITALLLALAPATGFGTELSDDLAARRARLMERFGPDAMIVLWSAPTRTYSLDVHYEYRQDSNLYYLTGMVQDETMLVLMPGNVARREILFVRDRDPQREHWQGRIMSRDEAAAHAGIATVLSTTQFEPFIAAMLSRRASGPVDAIEAAAFFTALDAGRARVAMVLDAAGLGDPLNQPQDAARRIRDRYAGFQVVDATGALTDLRLVKTHYEQKMMAKSLQISGDAQLAGMRAARPGAYEYEVEAAIEAVHRSRGAWSWAYPSIVGSGPNATILHYTESTRQMKAGELLLVDAACAFEYMAGDITRTYPVSGRFTQEQKDIYRVVLAAQDRAKAMIKPGVTFNDIQNAINDELKTGLLTLGLITDTSGDQFRMWATHNANHYIGLDVHDVGERTRPLEPGMMFVIEPGLYIRQAALDALPNTPENQALIEKIRPAVTRYADIGVRVEDAFVLEAAGLRSLTAAVPRTIEEIEEFMQKRVGSR